MSFTRILLAAVLLVSAQAAGLVDNPIVGDSVKYLDGDAWTATASGGPSDDCEFTQGIDWKPKDGKVSGTETGASTRDECCGHCLADATCAVAVFVPPGLVGGGTCWKKTASDISGGSYSRDGRVSCKKTKARLGVNAGLTVKGKVPGDLLTDLHAAGQIGDPLYELNWKNSSIWNDYTWTYTTSFSMTKEQLADPRVAEQILVFDGIKMGAHISVNGEAVGTAVDQFLRYEFPLKSTGLLRAGANTISVAFDPAIDVGGRFMSCTGGWDW